LPEESAPAPKGLQAWFQRQWTALKNEAVSPEKLGVAIGVGVFWGCSPFHGFQWMLALGSAWLFRLNKIAVLAGLQISFAPLTPLIIFTALQLGELLLHRRFLPVSLTQIREAGGDHVIRMLLVDFVVGSLSLGVLLGSLIGYTATLLLRRQQRSLP
jgi:hypothetical protein